MIEIREDNQKQHGGMADWRSLMTEEQIKRGQYYANQYRLRSAEVRSNEPDWNEIADLYACKREAFTDDPDYPNSFLPILTPTIEGQVASIIESNIEFSHISENPAHQAYMPKYDAVSNFVRRKNKFMQHFKDFGRYYDAYGNAWVTQSWEKSLCKKKDEPNGFPRLMIPPLTSVLVDGRIKDYKDIQYAEYIIHEIGFQSIAWARKNYGDEYADILESANSRYDGNSPSVSIDDADSFMLLHVWTRDNDEGNLQLIEMDAGGLILRESDASKPYYTYVDNEYPFYFGRMIPVLGNFYGIGDGHILAPIQKTINNLVDELELAARFSAQSKIAIDPAAESALEQYNSNPSEPMIVPDPQQNIMVIQGRGINGVVVQMIEILFKYSKIATRFNSEFMTGNQQGSSATATQISAQAAHGEIGIKDKRSDIAAAMEWADRYAIKLCLQYWKKPFWASLGNEYVEHIDPADMLKSQAIIPVTGGTVDKYLKRIENGENVEIPKYENVYNEFGEMVMSDVDFSTKIVMEPGIAKGKNDIYNMLLGLSQMTVVDKSGMVKPLISAARLKELIEQTIGMKLDTEQEDMEQEMINPATQQQLNPIGNNGVVQTPTSIPNNLMGTVPQVPNGDNRGLML